ncbi:MAG: response regulator transcription factor [Roseiflexaceae bacterium]|nr:response regulator transcription factor [Roseiflexus sp.]MDW8214526.1 response regulator transcription factor [Roseiflexaceae bacterium]
MIKILLVDNDPHIRRGLRMHFALEPDFAVVGEASDGWDALRLACELQPDVVVLDIRLTDLDGLSVAARLRQSQPRCAVIILTLYDEPANRARAARLGVTAFLLKGGSADELKQAIRQTIVTKGERP